MTYLVLYAVVYGAVAVRSFQQINVTHYHWGRIPITSYVFGLFEVMMYANMIDIVLQGKSLILAVLAMGTGGWTGCFTSMYIAERMGKSKEKRDEEAKRTEG
jgi:hypothetical protein